MVNAVNSNQYEIFDDEISGFGKTTFLTTKLLATKFPPPSACKTAIDTHPKL